MKRLVRRKWGWYLTMIDRKHFKVKLLWFRKNSSCSRQYHKQRSELWLMMAGTGFMEGMPLKSGEFCHVDVHGIHQFSTASKCAWIIEVQYGMSCEEGDIVRV